MSEIKHKNLKFLLKFLLVNFYVANKSDSHYLSYANENHSHITEVLNDNLWLVEY